MANIEIVPGSYGALIDTGYKDQFRNGYPDSCIAIEFVIPTGKNVLTDAYIYLGGGQWDVVHEVGFSRVLTGNSDLWVTYGTFLSKLTNWSQVIADAKLQTTGGIVRCNPGEVWYLIIKVNSGQPQGINVWFTIHGASSGFVENTTMYICNSGETSFISQEPFDGCLMIYGYQDEMFYVNFEYTPTKPVVNETVMFTDTSNQNLLEYRQWIIEGTPVGTGLYLSYTFTEPKIYGVTLIGVSYGGSNLQTNKLIDVSSEVVQGGVPWWIVGAVIVAGIIGAIIAIKKKK